ncbi:MAG: hypothetical protein RI563_05070 [Thiohalophilus sp.]|uniref:hypothetical protein n=1 Tax=Thiohalophilus sp. TaxID=3028392 RepID=UPI0028702BBB|nr:hypothetical protein [Thiohalophilus sp.]MDR9436225.1 hypothetical protein [Thiohalophilus sp.]
MLYTIEVDLDYDNHPHNEVHDIWNRLRRVLLAAGFHSDGRRFTINLPPTKARQLARRSMERLEHNLCKESRSLYRYVREFYGYPTTCADNLLLPPACAIEVHHDA